MIYSDINNFVDKQERKVKIECLIVKSKDVLTSVIEKNEELFDLVHETEDPDTACRDLEQWLERDYNYEIWQKRLLEGTLIRSKTKGSWAIDISPFKIRIAFDFLKKI